MESIGSADFYAVVQDRVQATPAIIVGGPVIKHDQGVTDPADLELDRLMREGSNRMYVKQEDRPIADKRGRPQQLSKAKKGILKKINKL